MNIKKQIRKIPFLIVPIRKILQILDKFSYKFMKEGTKTTLYFGRIFKYPSRSSIGKLIKRGFIWDGGIIRFYAKILPKDSIVIEVGSNIAASSIVISEFLPNSKLLLIEASERYFNYCKLNTNHLKKNNRYNSKNNIKQAKLVKLQTNHTQVQF